MPVFALRFQNLPARNSSLKIFKHEKEEKLAGPKGKLAGPVQFLVAEGLGPALNAKAEMQSYQYKDPHVKDKTVSQPSYLWHGNPNT